MESVFVIFDIDKTLLKTSSAHMLAYQDAFREACGIDTGIDVVEHHGRTELWIIPEVLKLYGWSDEKINQVLPTYFEALKSSFQKRFADEIPEVLPGVEELLGLLSQSGVTLAVVSGNSASIAREKLTKAGLNHYFTYGAFGDERLDRAELIKLALHRAEVKGRKFGFKALFGDAPPDIIAGQVAGFTTFGVATGDYSMSELTNLGADYVFDTLADTAAVLQCLRSL